MKKLIVIALVVCLIPVAVFAEDAALMMRKFNLFAKMYGGQQIDESTITEDTENRVVFSAENATIAFSTTSDKFNSALVVSADEAEFLPYCLCAAMSIDLSFNDDALQSFGNLLYCYLTVRSGKESEFGTFGGFLFNIKKDGDSYRFLIGEK